MLAETQPKIVIVGIGDDGLAGLTEPARQLLNTADLILGTASILRLVEELDAEKVPLEPDMSAASRQVREALSHARRPVLVSSGDPLFYGTTRYLCERIGKEQFEILPHVSSMQLAFARVKESWDDAYLASLAGRSLESIINRVRTADKVGLFSSEDCPPSRLARAMLDRGIDDFRAYVCEHLGSPDERVTQAELAELTGMEFDPLHVLILVRRPDRPNRPEQSARRLRFGNPDDAFLQSQPRRALVTQAEVRAIALAQLDIRPDSVVWDIGAGSGSVAIEAAMLAPEGTVYAIEPRVSELELLRSNAEAFGVTNVRTVAGRAPDALVELPDPDAVFVGGTGRHVHAILRAAFDRLRDGGRLAVNVAAIEALAEAHRLLKSLAGDVHLWNVAISRGVEQMERVRFQAVNPTFLLAIIKHDNAAPPPA
ncbi:bifunctional cobalt-precorrin-7 (C(5))-methyltransferase/cobalt-precorrin-6B (C(15))-methyltransferase [soil metagenome]